MKKKYKCFKCFLYFAIALSTFLGVSIFLYLIIFSNVTTNMADGTLLSYSLDVENTNVPFEDSNIFEYILNNQMPEITKMVVIKNQLETKGVFDPDKLVDIVEYSNRYDGYKLAMAPVYYKLDDLLKWHKIGIGLLKDSEVSLYGNNNADITAKQSGETAAQAKISVEGSATQGADSTTTQTDAYTDTTEATNTTTDTLTTGTAGATVATNQATITNSGIDIAGSQQNISDLELEIILNDENNDNWPVTYHDLLLNEIFLPADGNTLVYHSKSIAQYLKLKSFLQSAASDLYINYQNYSQLKDFYTSEESNVRYCYCINNNGENIYYTNTGIDMQGKSVAEITALFARYGKYLYYNPGTLDYETNTQLDSGWIGSYLDGYDYTFGNNSNVWIAVDMAGGYKVDDVYSRAKASYNAIYPNWWYYVAAIATSVLIVIGAGIGITVYEWKNTIQKLDKVPLEIYGGIIAVMIYAVIQICRILYYGVEMDNLKNGYTWLILGGVATVTILITTGIYSSLVRRIKARVLIKNSIIYYVLTGIWRVCVKLVKGIVHMFKKTYFMFYDNGKMMNRVFIPFILFLVINILLLSTGSEIGILLALIFDVASCSFIYWESMQRQKIVEGIRKIREGDFTYKLNTKHMHGGNLILADAVNEIGSGIKDAVETSMKDERLKADLITNVSHDIKTPLTSIINYVDIIKREDISNEKVRGYVDILDKKSQRLKQLTDDLVEASKISSGNIVLEMEKLDFVELMNQTIGEFLQKLEEKNLRMVVNMPSEPVFIQADSRRLWRVIENLFNNLCKYALENTRVYIDMKVVYNNDNHNLEEMLSNSKIELSIKNISANQLNIGAEELTERFIRGDVSRTTEGSGLGLSIAKNLTIAQGGKFEIYLDGDLFKVKLIFPAFMDK